MPVLMSHPGALSSRNRGFVWRAVLEWRADSLEILRYQDAEVLASIPRHHINRIEMAQSTLVDQAFTGMRVSLTIGEFECVLLEERLTEFRAIVTTRSTREVCTVLQSLYGAPN